MADVVVPVGAGRPVPRLFENLTVSDTDGARDLLASFWQHPDSQRISYVQISLAPSSSAGVYRSDGPGVTNGVGQYIPAGGAVLTLISVDEVRSLRMQAAAGGTITLSATAYLRGGR